VLILLLESNWKERGDLQSLQDPYEGIKGPYLSREQEVEMSEV
jgi:hypothetical protein